MTINIEDSDSQAEGGFTINAVSVVRFLPYNTVSVMLLIFAL
jgi:hypothetical protein